MAQRKPKLDVRTATAADAGILLALIGSAYRGEESQRGWTTEADLLTGDRIDEAGLLAKIAEPHGVLLLATDSDSDSDDSSTDAPVACCEILRRDEGSGGIGIGYFGLFAVDPRRQGAGLGKQVLQIAEAYARDALGIRRLEMQVIWTRAELIAWYMRRGYAGTGEKRRFPYELLVNGAAASRDDLYFEVLAKDLVAGKEVLSIA